MVESERQPLRSEPWCLETCNVFRLLLAQCQLSASCSKVRSRQLEIFSERTWLCLVSFTTRYLVLLPDVFLFCASALVAYESCVILAPQHFSFAIYLRYASFVVLF